MIHRLVAALALGAIGISVPLATAPAHAARWSDGPCTDNVGITVVIDFQELGGGVNVRCAPGPATTGLDALDKAGISWEGTLRFPGFVCRIAGVPGPQDEACANTPPATAYWSYWVAPRGGSWCYNTVGPGNRTPPPGAVEGWSFALDHSADDIPRPGYDPPAPIPGEPPNPLKRADCGTPSNPSPTSTPAPTTASPPVPTTVSAVQGPPSTATSAEPEPPGAPVVEPADQASAAPSASTTAGTLAGNGGSASTTSTTSSASTTQSTSTGASSTTEPRTSGTGETAPDDTSSGNTSSSLSSELDAVDLGDDGRGGGGFGVATAIGIVVAAALGGAGVWAARRRRTTT